MVYETLTIENKEAIFEQIQQLYVLTEALPNAVGKLDGKNNKSSQMAIALPLTQQLFESTKVVDDIYQHCIKSDSRITPSEKQQMEQAFQKIFVAIKHFSESVSSLPRPEQKPVLDGLDVSAQSALVESIRSQKSGTIQNELKLQAVELGKTHGGELINAALAAGDHAAGLVFAMEALFGISRDQAMPKFGMASDIARKGLGFNAEAFTIGKKQTPNGRFLNSN